MAYGKSTRYYEIPYMIDGDILDESDEAVRAVIIDNQLYAALSTMPCGVLKEGTYTGYDAGGGNYGLVIQAAGGPTIQGTINYRLVYDESSIVFSPMVSGNYYYLYLKAQPNLESSANSYVPVFIAGTPGTNPIAQNNYDYLFLATWDLTGGYPGTIDSDPVGKIYVTAWIDHINNSMNPHSDTLTQDTLIVRQSLTLTNGTSATTFGISQPATGSATALVTFTNAGTGPCLRSLSELGLQDTRANVNLSEAGNATFVTVSQSIIGAVNEHVNKIGQQAHGLGAVSILDEITTVQKTLNQVLHGFSVGNAIRNNGSAYVLAQANDDSTLNTVGVVSVVLGPDDFTVVYSGMIDTLAGLTAGASYYLSEVTPGLLTNTEPVMFKKIILEATSTTSGVVVQQRLNEGASQSKVLMTYEAVTAGDFINILNDIGAAKVRKTRANITGGDTDGFVLESANIGTNVRVFLSGINSVRSGLTPGSLYYLDPSSPGNVTSTPPTMTGFVVQKVGKALSATELTFAPSEPVLIT